MRKRCGVVLCLGIALPAPGPAAEPLPVGGQFQVNSYTSNNQRFPAVAVGADGEFVVIWQSDGASGDAASYSIQGQRYAAGGTALGGQFQINSYTTGAQRNPSLAVDAAGNFVVVWQSIGSSGNDTLDPSIQGQRYSAAGAEQDGQFQVNSYTTNFQTFPAVAFDSDGNYVVAWQSVGSFESDTAVESAQVRRYDATGAALGPEFQVNSYTTGSQRYPSVARNSVGEFVVVWQGVGSSGGDTSAASIQGQRYAANGNPLGGEFQVNTYTNSFQYAPAIASDPAGNFVVVWQSDGSGGGDSLNYSVQGQRYSATGIALGNEFQVNSYTTGRQKAPAVAADADGDFVVVWESNGSGGSDVSSYSIQGRLYSADGAPLGSEFQVNTYTSSFQQAPSVALDAEGDFVVVWNSNGSSASDTSQWSVQGQRYRVTGDLQGRVFHDQDADGIQDAGEPGIAAVTVELFDATQVLRRTALTGGDGTFFLRPKEGSWHLRFVAPSGYSFTARDVGGNDSLDSDADPVTGETDPFPVAIAVLEATIDAGLTRLVFADGFESATTNAWSASVP